MNLQGEVNFSSMTSTHEMTTQLVRELSEVKRWPEQFKEKLKRGLHIGSQIAETDEKMETLEKRARKLI